MKAGYCEAYHTKPNQSIQQQELMQSKIQEKDFI